MATIDPEAGGLAARLAPLLDASGRRHCRLCPRQVLGVRIGLAGGAAAGVDVPRDDKRLLAILETDGCFVSGIEAATGCHVARRTLRIEDYGKTAATFVDVETERAVRLAPRQDVRDRALAAAPDARSRWHAMLEAYQTIPDEQLLEVQEVRLRRPLAAILSRPHVRVVCAGCGEEIINEREVNRDGEVLCTACAAGAYYL